MRMSAARMEKEWAKRPESPVKRAISSFDPTDSKAGRLAGGSSPSHRLSILSPQSAVIAEERET